MTTPLPQEADRATSTAAGRDQRKRQARASVVSQVDPFAAIQGDAEFDLAERAFG